jgi:hypothetical protein
VRRRFWTSEDVIEWIRVNVPATTLGEATAIDSAIWWCAYRNAEAIYDLGIKDLARELVGGGLLGIDYDSVGELVMQWCDEEGNEPNSENAAVIDDEIENDLRKFFVVRKEDSNGPSGS